MAGALAEAGADIIGVSAALERPAARSERRGSGRSAGRSRAYRADLADRAAVRDLAARLAGADRPVDILVNNAGTIRRAPAAEHTRRRLGPRAGGGPLRAVRAGPRGRPAHARTGQRQDHLHRVDAQLPGRHQRRRLRRRQVRHRRADAGPGQRVGAAAASTSTPSPPATSPPTTPRPCGTTRSATAPSWNASPPGGGAGRTTSPAPPSSSRPTPPPTFTAPSCPSTAAGCRGDQSPAGLPLCQRVAPTRAVRVPVRRDRLGVQAGTVAGVER